MVTNDASSTLGRTPPETAEGSRRPIEAGQIDAAPSAFGQAIRFLDWLLRIFPS